MNKKALCTGVTGQDGSYLAELLLSKGYEVYGIIRRSSTPNTSNISHLINNPNFTLLYGDLSDSTSLRNIIRQVKPDEVYNLAAQSHVKVSFENPEYTADVDGVGVVRLLESIREECPSAKFYQASTSEMFGKVKEVPQSEKTPFHPRSPYGCAKVYGYWITKNYRESYDMFTCNGILFNHESERRGEEFVTRKITLQLAEISLGKREVLKLGNLDAKRDWGHAEDYVEAMWLILQQDNPDDYVISSNETHSVREFVQIAANHLGYDIEWKGEGVEEKGYDTKTGKLLIEVDPRYFRPAEVDLLIGDSTKAREVLDWQPKNDFSTLIKRMVENDVETLSGRG